MVTCMVATTKQLVRPKMPEGTVDLLLENPEGSDLVDEIKSLLLKGKKVYIHTIGTLSLRPKIRRTFKNMHGTYDTKPGYRIALRASTRAAWLSSAAEKLAPKADVHRKAPKSSIRRRSAKV